VPSTVIAIPCFNEEHRLRVDEVRALCAFPKVTAVLVDDGSTDATRVRLEEIAADLEGRACVLSLGKNLGKAEAVRQGLLHGLSVGAQVVGYLDADFSTPAEEMGRLLTELELEGRQVVMGARVARAGARVIRSASRHYLGRVFATAASIVLGQPFYDTQCGAKAMRATPALREALSRPFVSRWAFDVELLGRLLTATEPLAPEAFAEIPLRYWKHVGSSRLRVGAMIGAAWDLLRIRHTLGKP
jgi:glycosyltransferase involved in cell wall biosynthesis